jgi:hypothetical protein
MAASSLSTIRTRCTAPNTRNKALRPRAYDVPQRLAIDGHPDAIGSEQQSGLVAATDGWNGCKEPRQVIRVERAGCPTVLLKALLPCLARVVGRDVAKEADVEQLGLRRAQN